jgi:hypothetical protein
MRRLTRNSAVLAIPRLLSLYALEPLYHPTAILWSSAVLHTVGDRPCFS